MESFVPSTLTHYCLWCYIQFFLILRLQAGWSVLSSAEVFSCSGCNCHLHIFYTEKASSVTSFSILTGKLIIKVQICGRHFIFGATGAKWFIIVASWADTLSWQAFMKHSSISISNVTSVSRNYKTPRINVQNMGHSSLFHKAMSYGRQQRKSCILAWKMDRVITLTLSKPVLVHVFYCSIIPYQDNHVVVPVKHTHTLTVVFLSLKHALINFLDTNFP